MNILIMDISCTLAPNVSAIYHFEPNSDAILMQFPGISHYFFSKLIMLISGVFVSNGNHPRILHIISY